MAKVQTIFGQFYQPSTTAVFDTVIAKNLFQGYGNTLSSITGNIVVSTAAPTSLLIYIVMAGDQTANSTDIVWGTNIKSTSQIFYGLTATNLNMSTIPLTSETHWHFVSLTGLGINNTYYFIVSSTALSTSSLTANSQIYNFITTGTSIETITLYYLDTLSKYSGINENINESFNLTDTTFYTTDTFTSLTASFIDTITKSTLNYTVTSNTGNTTTILSSITYTIT